MTQLREGRVRVDDHTELHYVGAGAGDPVVLVPGFMMDHRVFTGQLEGLSKTRRVIAIDPRSQGRSTQSRDRNTYPQQGDDLAACFDALDLEHVTLCGWSFGGLASYAYVAAHGIDRLRALVIIDMTPIPLGPATAGAWSDGTLDVYIDEMAAPIVRDHAAFVRAGLDSMLARPPTEADRVMLETMQLQTQPDAAISLLISATHSDYTELAQQLDTTLPVAYAIRTDWLSQAEPWLAQNAPRAAVWTLRSHLGFWEDPSDFNTKLDRFLSSA